MMETHKLGVYVLVYLYMRDCGTRINYNKIFQDNNAKHAPRVQVRVFVELVVSWVGFKKYFGRS